MSQAHKRYPVRRGRRKNERGFALLLVFLLASAVALMLYRQMPREAFESERDKEQMLIDRGEQYKRAIYLYYVANNRQWPTKIEDLESTNNHRYLRHRYVDPYTGKDEWRLVHTNGAFLTDSLVTPPPAQSTPGGAPGSATASAPLGGTGMLTNLTTASTTTSTADPNAPPEVNAQVGRRPSDRVLVQNSEFAGPPSQGNDPVYQPFNPAALPPISLYPNGYNAPPVNSTGVNGVYQPPGVNQPGQPGLNQPGLNQPGFNQPGFNQPGQPGFNQPGQPIQPGQPGSNPPVVNQPGVPGFTIPGTNSQITTPGINAPNQQANFNQPGGNLPGFPTGQQSNQPNFPGATPGAPGTGASNQAIGLINNLLTTPRQAPTGVGQQPAAGGGGLAGVASTHKGAAIKSYGDRTKYQEWEFIFQLNPQGNLQMPQGGGLRNGQPTGGPLGNPGATGAPGMPGAPGSTTPGGITSGGTNSGTISGGLGTN